FFFRGRAPTMSRNAAAVFTLWLYVSLRVWIVSMAYRFPRYSNHVFVALAMDCGSHRGASRHAEISAIIRRTPSSKEITGFQSRSPLILVMSAQVTSGSPGRLGI